jgi:FkbM family methyltransferase
MIKRIKRAVRSLLASDDRFLKECSGIIHVGANEGQERDRYARHNLRVLWIEPIPEVFARLQSNIKDFPNQRAIEALVTDRDGGEYQFNIASNQGASSSILEFKEHKDIWPSITFERTIMVAGFTLPTLLRREGVDPSDYDALLIDTQGSELLVLQGAVPILHHFKYIKAEAPDFESYANCCQVADLDAFMAAHGFREHRRTEFARRKEGGAYYDIVYERRTSAV